MIMEFAFYESGEFESALYYDADTFNVESIKNEVVLALMEFKTECILNVKPYNVYHFINWLKKYKGIELTTTTNECFVRIDM